MEGGLRCLSLGLWVSGVGTLLFLRSLCTKVPTAEHLNPEYTEQRF